ncbi:hypothetical protein NDI34_25115 [Trichocoleus sp. DQ-U1]
MTCTPPFLRYAHGTTFETPTRIDFISQPQIFYQILSVYAEILKDLHFDRIAGIPYGSLATATGLALRLDRPMIFLSNFESF